MDPHLPLAWMPPAALEAPTLDGVWVSVAPLHPGRDAATLWEAFGGDDRGAGGGADEHLRWFGWDRMLGAADLAEHLTDLDADRSAAACVFRTPDGDAVGTGSYLSMKPDHGVVEIGALAHARACVGTAASTEAHFLLLDHAFTMGYRRVEWRCNAGDEASRRGADRLGFRHEGTLRQHRVSRDHNRDTACFSLLDREWPERRAALVEWLRPVNFDEEGRQRTRLRRRPIDAVRPGKLKLPG